MHESILRSFDIAVLDYCHCLPWSVDATNRSAMLTIGTIFDLVASVCCRIDLAIIYMDQEPLAR